MNKKFGGISVGKLETNKKVKKNALFQNAFELFTDKGFAKTTISDIVSRAGLAKGTFYLYFKDKYDLRDKLIVYKGGQLFYDAYEALVRHPVSGFEQQLFFVTDYIIERLKKDHSLLQFLAKNLSWGIFRTAFSSNVPKESEKFYDYYLSLFEKDHIHCKDPELMLFTIIELVNATCYNCILFEEPVTIDEYLPYLHLSISQIFRAFTSEEPVTSSETVQQ